MFDNGLTLDALFPSGGLMDAKEWLYQASGYLQL